MTAAASNPILDISLVDSVVTWDEQRQLLRTLAATAHGKRKIICIISREALEAVDGGADLDEAGCLDALSRHRDRIATIAARRLSLYGTDSDDALRITSEDVYLRSA